MTLIIKIHHICNFNPRDETISWKQSILESIGDLAVRWPFKIISMLRSRMDCLLLSLLLFFLNDFLKIHLFKKSFLFGNNFRFIEVTRNSQAMFIQSHLFLTFHFFITFVFSSLSLSLSLYKYISSLQLYIDLSLLLLNIAVFMDIITVQL